MATLRSNMRTKRSAKEVWTVVSDAGDIAAWLPAITQSAATADTRHGALAVVVGRCRSSS